MDETQIAALETLTEPPRELYPTSDLRFVLLEIGQLAAKVDMLSNAVRALDRGTEPDPRQTIAFVKGAVWALGCFVVGVLLGWFMSGKIGISLHWGM